MLGRACPPPDLGTKKALVDDHSAAKLGLGGWALGLGEHGMGYGLVVTRRRVTYGA